MREMHMKRPKIVCGWNSAPDPAGGAYDAPPDPLVSWRKGHPPHSFPLDAFDRCSAMFVLCGDRNWTTPNFWNVAAPLALTVKSAMTWRRHRLKMKWAVRVSSLDVDRKEGGLGVGGQSSTSMTISRLQRSSLYGDVTGIDFGPRCVTLLVPCRISKSFIFLSLRKCLMIAFAWLSEILIFLVWVTRIMRNDRAKKPSPGCVFNDTDRHSSSDVINRTENCPLSELDLFFYRPTSPE